MSEKYYGYRTTFLGRKYRVGLPDVNPAQRKKIADVAGTRTKTLKYGHYSVQQHAERGFPFWSASNIDGKTWMSIPRRDLFGGNSDDWDRDNRLKRNHQWGEELYRAQLSDFDQGHMTKREDVQWGDTREEAMAGALSTFFFTNAVPQHKDLNRRIWARLEDYILESEARPRNLRISVFTGPALREDDPYFVTPVQDESVQLPVWFWKIVYYVKPDGKLYRVGFLMNQSRLLEKDQVIKRRVAPPPEDAQLFQRFKEAKTYQVSVALLEHLTGLKFHKAEESYTDERPTELVMDEVRLQPRAAAGGSSPFAAKGKANLPEIKGLQL